MGIKNIRYIIGAMILISVITGCTQVTPDGEKAPVAVKPTEITITEVAETPKPTSSPTPLPTVVAGQALQVYRTMLIIQANAEQLQEVAILVDPQEVELNLKESPMMMSLSVSIVTVNDLMSNVQAPNTISLPWNRAHLVHQETERVLQSWLIGESTSS